MIQAFLLGALAAMFVTAAVFFLRFWRETRDSFLLAFAAAFLMDGFSRVALLFVARPNEGSPWVYVVRLIGSLLILAAILKKNYGRNG